MAGSVPNVSYTTPGNAPGYPLVLHHPQHAPAVISGPYDPPGAPERYPAVEVHSPDQEEMFRAKGYLRLGERPAVMTSVHEFPKMMSHPDHQDGAIATKASVLQGNQVVVVDVPAKPERFPDVAVNSLEEQEAWEAKGYRPAGSWDEVAFERSIDAPGEPGDEWPKWIDGELVQDPNRVVSEANAYPKWIHFEDNSELAKDAEDEKRIRAARGASRHEPVKRSVSTPAVAPSDFAEWQEFQAFKKWKAAQAAGASEMVAEPVTEPEPPADNIEDLRKQAAELNIQFDKRWGAARLQRAIDLSLSQ